MNNINTVQYNGDDAIQHKMLELIHHTNDTICEEFWQSGLVPGPCVANLCCSEQKRMLNTSN